MTQIFELKTREDWERGLFDDITLIERVAPSGIATAQLILAADYGTYYTLESDNPAISFSGSWNNRIYAGSISDVVKETIQTGAQAVVDFEGFGADLFYIAHDLGGVAKVEIDDLILANIDMYAPAISSMYARYFVGHGTHRLTLEHTGRAREMSYWLGTVEDVVGTSISPNVTLYPRVEDTQDGEWGIYAETNYTFYLLNRRTNQISSSFYVSSGRRRAFVPGVSVIIGTTNLPLIPGDEASFSTFSPRANIDAVRVYTHQQTVGRYASPVFDSLEGEANYWPALEFEVRNPVGKSIQLFGKTGDVPTPDSSWTISTGQDLPGTDDYFDPLYGEVHRFGFEDLPVGRYFQFEAELNSGSPLSKSPVLQKMKLFFTPMKRDRFFNFFPQPYTTWLINGFTRFIGAIRSVLLWLNKAADDLIKSYSISYATDEYLTTYGEELKVPRRFAESEDAYRARLLSMFRGYGQGGTKSFLEGVIGAYVGQPVVVEQRTPQSMGWIMGFSYLGVDTYLGMYFEDAFVWDVYIPVTYVGVTEDQIRDFIHYLRPVGTIYNVIWT